MWNKSDKTTILNIYTAKAGVDSSVVPCAVVLGPPFQSPPLVRDFYDVNMPDDSIIYRV
jgi:hypothetical protein